MTTEIDVYGESEDPWDILPEESTKAYEAFARFRDLGPSRTRKDAAVQLGVGVASLKEWAGRHAWEDRARAYDLELDRKRRVILESERLAMRQRHANAAVFLQKKVAERFALMDPMEMTPKDAVYAMDLASKLERVSRGEADARVELTGANGGPIEVAEAMTTEDRAVLMAQVQAELAKRIGVNQQIEDVLDAEIVDE